MAGSGKSLAKNTSILMIGQVSTKILTFLLLPLYTAFLTTEQYGTADLFITYGSLIVVVFGLQVTQSIFRFLTEHRDDSVIINRIISTSFYFTCFLAGIFAVSFFGIRYLLPFEYNWLMLVYVIWLLFFQTFSNVSRGIGKNGSYAFANFLAAAISLSINVVLSVFWGFKDFGIVLGSMIGPIIGSIYLFFRIKMWRYLSPKHFEKQSLKTILKFCLPLIPNELSWAVIHASDRVIISNKIGLAANGLVSAASKFGSIFTTVFNVFGMAWTEQIVLMFRRDGCEAFFQKYFEKIVFIFASFAILLIASMPIVFPLMVNSSFAEAYYLVPIYMGAVFFNAIIGITSAIMIADNKTWEIAITTIIAAILNIVVDLMLVNYIGIYAAPVSSLVSYLAITIWRVAIINRRYYKIRIGLKYVVCIFAILPISLLSFYGSYGTRSVIAFCFVIVLFILFTAKDDVKLILSMIFKKIKRRQ